MKFLVLFLFVFLSACVFDSDTEEIVGNQEKIGFQIITHGGSNSDSVSVAISWFNALIPYPTIVVNGDSVADKKYINAAIFENIEAGKYFNYVIKYKNYELTDSIYIPGMVTGLKCNGVLLPDTSDIEIDSASNYSFTWDSIGLDGHYSIGYRGSIIENSINSQVIDTPSLNIRKENSNKFSNSFYLEIAHKPLPILQANLYPSIENENMYAYYDLTGPDRSYFVRVK